jgi:hypothetical protein
MREVLACKRYWLPIVAGLLLVIASCFAGPVLTWIMLTASFGLILDGVTAMMEKAGGTGNLTTYKQ